jgi:nicotinamide-nucleotide adenylyltransferase
LSEKARFGMIHGRFQPFHLGHLEYMKAALQRCDTLIVAITNPDPSAIREEQLARHRHTDEANPYTFFQRLMMIRETLLDEGVDLRQVMIVPFPINFPERWHHYLPPRVLQFIRIFSPWEQQKADRFRELGFQVEVLHPGSAKRIEGTEARRLIRQGGAWRALVPPGVARVIERIEAGEL